MFKINKEQKIKDHGLINLEIKTYNNKILIFNKQTLKNKVKIK